MMRDNLTKMVERGERLDDLEQRTGTAVCGVCVGPHQHSTLSRYRILRASSVSCVTRRRVFGNIYVLCVYVCMYVYARVCVCLYMFMYWSLTDVCICISHSSADFLNQNAQFFQKTASEHSMPKKQGKGTAVAVVVAEFI